MLRLSSIKPVARMLVKETLIALLLLLGVSFVIFAVLSFAPGDPFSQVLGKGSQVKSPVFGGWIGQYLIWLANLFQGNLGNSLQSGLPVLQEVIRTSINTLYLTIGAMSLSLLIAVPLAVYTAKRGPTATSSWVITAITYILSALPSFWFGYIVIYIAMHQFQMFPLAFASSGQGWQWTYFLLPVLVLGLCGTGLSETVRYLREELTRVLAQDYIRTAKAKGASVWKHSFKEGFLLPITEMIASKIPFILGGAVVVEQVFNWQGMGRLAWQAAQDRDFPMIMGITLMAALFVRLGSLLKKMVHIIVNPRSSQV